MASTNHLLCRWKSQESTNGRGPLGFFLFDCFLQFAQTHLNKPRQRKALMAGRAGMRLQSMLTLVGVPNAVARAIVRGLDTKGIARVRVYIPGRCVCANSVLQRSAQAPAQQALLGGRMACRHRVWSSPDNVSEMTGK